MHGATERRGEASLTRGLREPLEVWHGDERLVLRPEDGRLRGRRRRTAPGRAGGGLARPPRALPDRGLARAFAPHDRHSHRCTVMTRPRSTRGSTQVIAEHDRPPGAPIPVLESLTLKPGQPGLETDRAAAKNALLAGLAKAGDRSVKLPVEETPSATDRRQGAWHRCCRLGSTSSLASAASGCTTCRPAKRSRSTRMWRTPARARSRFPILEQVYRKLDQPPGIETSKIISETMMH